MYLTADRRICNPSAGRLLIGLLTWFLIAGPARAQIDIAPPLGAVPQPITPANSTAPAHPALTLLPPVKKEPPQGRSEALEERLPDLPDDKQPDLPNGQEPDAPIEQQPDSQVEPTQEAVADELARPAEEDPNYALLSARIDALDRLVESELSEKEEFRTGLLEAITELEEVASDDRDTRFFDQAGFRYQTTDKQYELAIRGQVQTDARIFGQDDQEPVNSGFFLPRSRVYFAGRVTRAIEYHLSLQRGFNNLNVLNSYVRFRYGDNARLTIGRFKTPYTYDFYTYKNWQLLSPERSLFNVNFALNRMVGAMLSGTVLENRLEYAVGIFDGPRNSFRDTNSAKDVVAFLNFQPWRGAGGKNFNVGGSVAYGRQDNPLRPAALRTSANASTNRVADDTTLNNANVPFLEFNADIREFGERNLWELHTSLYLGPLTVLAAWDSGYSGYARQSDNTSVRVPLDGYHVQIGYMLTGETKPGPVDLRPLRPFNPHNPADGPGAWQVVTRYSYLNVGEEVFTAGLADPTLWTRRVQMIDVGLNWYLNRFTAVSLDWEHAIFAKPVAFNPTPEFQIDSDLFWARLNLIF